jgi:hypothetical protein
MCQCGQAGVQTLNGIFAVRHLVTPGKELQLIVGEPDFSVLIFPNQGAERQVEPNSLPTLHQWRTGLRIAEDQDLRRTKAEPNLACFGGVVNVREELNPFRDKKCFETLNRLIHPVSARQRLQTGHRGLKRVHAYLRFAFLANTPILD